MCVHSVHGLYVHACMVYMCAICLWVCCVGICVCCMHVCVCAVYAHVCTLYMYLCVCCVGMSVCMLNLNAWMLCVWACVCVCILCVYAFTLWVCVHMHCLLFSVQDTQFSTGPHIQAREPRSVACLPPTLQIQAKQNQLLSPHAEDTRDFARLQLTVCLHSLNLSFHCKVPT